MKIVAIIFTHLGSGSGVVFDALSRTPRVDCFRTGMTYDHYDKILELTSNRHKNENASAIWLDEVLYNHQFTCKPLMEHLKPIFVLREPRGTLAEILATHPEYDASRAADYYCYRIRGLCEYAHRTRSPFLVTYEDMSLTGIEAYLGLKEPVGVSKPEPRVIPDVSHDVIERCELCYELHMGHIKRAGT